MKKLFLSLALVGIMGAAPISTFASFSKKNVVVLNNNDKDKDKKSKKSGCCAKSADGKASCKKGDASATKTDATKSCTQTSKKSCCKKTTTSAETIK